MRNPLFLIPLLLGLSCAHSGPAGGGAQAQPGPKDPTPESDAKEESPTAATPPSDLVSYELDLASVVWPPFTDEAGKERLATNLVEAALKRAGVVMRSHTTEPGDVTRSIEEGKFDGSEALWKSPERELHLFYSKPYLENRLVLLARKGSDVGAKSLSELKKKKVGLVDGYAYGAGIEAAPEVDFVRAKTDEENLRALLEKKVDFILVDDLLVYHLFEYQKEKARKLLVAGEYPLILRGLHLAIRKDVPGATEILERFDAQILDMIRSGEYHRILNVSWLLADVDGDGKHEVVASTSQVGTLAPHQRYQLFGPRMEGAPRFMIEGEVYNDWKSVPPEYKVPNQPVPEFRPLLGAVLFEF